MNFTNLSANTCANLERACEELKYYADRPGVAEKVAQRAHDLRKEIETATPKNAGELFKQARLLCLDIEKKL